jgi:divalent metal cation (Fe/Co/Zn/Cd) transporter
VKYKSQTLATEALNFRTDILASLVALCAILVSSLTSFWFADSVGAIIVSIIALIFAVKLAKHAINVLLDYAPEEWVTKVRQIATTTQNVLEVNNVRVREVGTNLYIDLTVRVARSLSFEQSHDIATEIEHKVHALSHDVDIVVHIEPIATDDESLIDRIRASASRSGKAIHNIHVYTIADQVYAQLDLEVNPNLDLQQAHGLSQELELILRKEFALAHVSIHIEPNTFLEHGSKQKLQQHLEKSNIGRSVERIARHNRDVQRVHNLVLDQVGDEINLSLDCELNPMMSLESAHIIAEKFERELRVKLPKLARVSIHTEPQGAEDL